MRAFCREQKISEYSFYWWRKQIGSSVEEPIRLALVETAASSPVRRQEPLELVLASGERLHIPAEAATLRLVLSVLREQADR